jgi:hypothetical protein
MKKNLTYHKQREIMDIYKNKKANNKINSHQKKKKIILNNKKI